MRHSLSVFGSSQNCRIEASLAYSIKGFDSRARRFRDMSNFHQLTVTKTSFRYSFDVEHTLFALFSTVSSETKAQRSEWASLWSYRWLTVHHNFTAPVLFPSTRAIVICGFLLTAVGITVAPVIEKCALDRAETCPWCAVSSVIPDYRYTWIRCASFERCCGKRFLR